MSRGSPKLSFSEFEERQKDIRLHYVVDAKSISSDGGYRASSLFDGGSESSPESLPAAFNRIFDGEEWYRVIQSKEEVQESPSLIVVPFSDDRSVMESAGDFLAMPPYRTGQDLKSQSYEDQEEDDEDEESEEEEEEVFCVPSNPVRRNLWTKKESVRECVECEMALEQEHEKHNCNYCGRVFCNHCTRFRRPILGGSRRRLCKDCNRYLANNKISIIIPAASSSNSPSFRSAVASPTSIRSPKALPNPLEKRYMSNGSLRSPRRRLDSPSMSPIKPATLIELRTSQYSNECCVIS